MASSIITPGSLMARLTPDSMTGLPAKRSRSRTPTSVAKMTASAAAMVSGETEVLFDEPWVSTVSSTSLRSSAVCVNASAAM